MWKYLTEIIAGIALIYVVLLTYQSLTQAEEPESVITYDSVFEQIKLDNGVYLLIDSNTGCQYLLSNNITPRLNASGEPLCISTDADILNQMLISPVE